MVERFYGPLIGFEMLPGNRGDWVRYIDHAAETAALKKQVEELTAERDALEVKAVSLLWAVPGETLCGEVQSLLTRALELQSAEAEVAALRKALEEIRKLSGLDDLLIEGASAIVMSRMADIHQHSDAALASTRETSDA